MNEKSQLSSVLHFEFSSLYSSLRSLRSLHVSKLKSGRDEARQMGFGSDSYKSNRMNDIWNGIVEETEGVWGEIETGLEGFVARLGAKMGEVLGDRGGRVGVIVDNYKKIIAEKDEIIKEFEAKLVERESVFKLNKKKLEQKLEKISMDLNNFSKIEAENRSLIRELEKMRSNFDQLEKERDREKEKAMNHEPSKLEKIVEKIELLKPEIDEKVARYKTKIAILKEKSRHLEQTILQLSEENNNVQLENVKLKSKIDQLTLENNNLLGVIRAQEDEQAALKVKKKILKDKVKKLENLNENLGLFEGSDLLKSGSKV